jgi:DNA ligase (NAD+)
MAELDDIAQRMEWLRREIERHEHLYRIENLPEISDSEFDRLVKELESLEAEYPLFVRQDSPTRKVGDDRLPGFETVKHRIPMQSLDNTYNQEELVNFDTRLKRLLGDAEAEYLVEPKIDGLAISLVFEYGRFVQAITRATESRGMMSPRTSAPFAPFPAN